MDGILNIIRSCMCRTCFFKFICFLVALISVYGSQSFEDSRKHTNLFCSMFLAGLMGDQEYCEEYPQTQRQSAPKTQQDSIAMEKLTTTRDVQRNLFVQNLTGLPKVEEEKEPATQIEQTTPRVLKDQNAVEDKKCNFSDDCKTQEPHEYRTHIINFTMVFSDVSPSHLEPHLQNQKGSSQIKNFFLGVQAFSIKKSRSCVQLARYY